MIIGWVIYKIKFNHPKRQLQDSLITSDINHMNRIIDSIVDIGCTVTGIEFINIYEGEFR